ncbi:aldo/keto reductase [Cellulomonas sp. Sa3CUA2]|uniref:Aldo/keto reductase n=1 Tax=Cellulomonas avistercoris TaxID=2762242 RepID=A0ABR8QBS3_9CELL|nr:aldo/keto reductase [Cellulomonas avistercoris]MBD7917882.1 aldo/keto reductase [Cellulomonas avistercoris]
MTARHVPGGPGWMRPLPGTGLTVSALALGGSPLGSMPENYGHDVSPERGIDTVRAVLGSDIRFVDTSNGYSGGESERRIGAALTAAGGVPPGYVIATKVDPEGADYSGERVRRSVLESRARLGLDHLPLVHLHDPEFHEFDDITGPDGAVEALVELRESGAVGAIGLAGGRVQEMARYLALGVFDVLLVHNRWTLVDRSAGALITEARAQGMGVLNAAVYGGGILARGPGAPATYGYRPAPPQLLEAVGAMRRVCAEHGTDLTTAALQFSLRDEQVASTVVGMSRPERVAQTLAAAAADLPDELFDELETLVPPSGTWLDAPFDT